MGDSSHASGLQTNNVADSTDPGKLFVGGLSWQTTPESLKQYFQKFGELKECFIMCDPVTRRSRGFGFVTFNSTDDSEKAVAADPHILDGKKIDPKKAFPKVPNSKYVTKTKKVFVGGIQHGTSEDDLREYFEKFGTVTEVVIMIDKITTRCRGFGFITFETEEAVDKCCDERYHIINSKRVECKKAQPKEVMFPPQGRGIYLGRGLISRPGYIYGRTDYSPVIGYFQPQFNPARTRFVSPTPPHTPAFMGHAYPGAMPGYGPGMDRRAIASYMTDYNNPLAMAAVPAGVARGRELSSSPTIPPQGQHDQFPDGYTHFASPIYSPFSASPSPNNPQHFRTPQINGTDTLQPVSAPGLPMGYNSLTVSSNNAYSNQVNQSYSQTQRF